MFVQSWLKSTQSTEQYLLHQFQILFQLLLFHTMYACTILDVLLIRPAHWEHFDPLHRFHHKRAVISTKIKELNQVHIAKLRFEISLWVFRKMSLHSSLTKGLSKDENFPRVTHALLCFSKTCELWSSKAAFTIAFFAAVNHNIYFYDSKQQTSKYRNT